MLMIHDPASTPAPEPTAIANPGTHLAERVRGEYREMPGLQLTLAQACRLWNTDVTVSQHVLDALVETAFLRRSGTRYVRADSGRMCA
jgi:hypothetical protein